MQTTEIGVYDEAELQDGPFAITDTKFIFPTVIAPRIGSQRGLFSVHSNPDRNWILRDKTERQSINSEDKPDFLDRLYGLGVDSAMVMADLDGICANLAWRYRTGRPM